MTYEQGMNVAKARKSAHVLKTHTDTPVFIGRG